MITMSSLEEIERLYASRGGLNYGEGVTQLEHALQCAGLAEAQSAPPSFVAAALLHDIGHLFVSEENAAAFDDRHEIAGAQALKGIFDEAVCYPIALHVAAKRYLCFSEAQYFETLSPASRHSLALQGGAFDAAQAAAFEGRPYWRDAIALRRFDDTGKDDGQGASRCFADFAPLLRSLRISAATS